MEVTIADGQLVDLQEKIELFFEEGKANHQFCPVRDILDRFGDKWSLLAILNLGYSGKTRFNELKSKIDGISQRMLTVTLRSLERDGLITRQIFAEVPPRVEYELTQLGRSLLQQIFELAQWASVRVDEIVRARAEYDKRLQ
ncbi:MAG TPA: helix-turn-helix domain-containing protein [Prolixibacteraceae bacterium]|nr:helix-turn-helix domain-containing protein [Prolixibacteraceae bacterium]